MCQFCLLSFWHLTFPIISNPIRICEKHLGQKDKLKSPVRLRRIGLECLLRPPHLFELRTHLDSVASSRYTSLFTWFRQGLSLQNMFILFSLHTFICLLLPMVSELVALNGQGVPMKTFTYHKIPQANSF